MSKPVTAQYKRGEVIGRGNFGVVYKGYNVETRQVVAIKVLDLDTKEDDVRDVQHEITLLSQLSQNPDAVNITKYYGSYLHGTKLWIIMDLCSGGSIRTLLKPGRVEERYISIIVRELLLSLSYIHKEGVIHRDIKAANVLITNDGRVRLCDFGVAAEVSATKHKRSTIVGTPYWMAPEVITEGVFYNSKADIWSLGITVYEIACGNPPYSDQEAMRAIMLIPRQKPARLEGPAYSSALKEFVALCLDEHPNERPSADELLKTKFVKLSKSLPTTMLKDLVQRYVVWKQKPGNNYRDSMAVLNKMRPVHLSDDEDGAGLADKMAPAAAVSSEDAANMSNDSGDWPSVEDTVWDFDIEGLPDSYQDSAALQQQQQQQQTSADGMTTDDEAAGTFRQFSTANAGAGASTPVGLGLSAPTMKTVVNFNDLDGVKSKSTDEPQPPLKPPQSLLELFENTDESSDKFNNYVHTPPLDNSMGLEAPHPVEIEIPSFEDINSSALASTSTSTSALTSSSASVSVAPTSTSLSVAGSMGPPPPIMTPAKPYTTQQTSGSATPSPSVSRKPSLYHSNVRSAPMISSTPNLTSGINSSNIQMRKRSPSPKRMEPLPSNSNSGSNNNNNNNSNNSMRPLNFASQSTTAIPSLSQSQHRGLERKNSLLSSRPGLKTAASGSSSSTTSLAEFPSSASNVTPTTSDSVINGITGFKRPSRPTNLRITMPMQNFPGVASSAPNASSTASLTASMESRESYEDLDTTLEDIDTSNKDGFPDIPTIDMSILLDSTPRDRVVSQLTNLLQTYSTGLKRIEDNIIKYAV